MNAGRFLLSAALGIVAAAVVSVALVPLAATEPPVARDVPAVPRIGLVDVAEVFNNYRKFQVLRDELQAELAERDRKASGMAAQIKQMQNRLESDNVRQGSPEHQRLRRELAVATAEFEDFRQSAQDELRRKEAQNFKTIWLEVADAVGEHAEEQGLTLVLRFDRGELPDVQDPAKLIQSIQCLSLYHRPDDDITDAILDRLNRRYAASN
jgi:Skp family chaperone for outer membrane proteins